nr:alpha-amylase family glycosyl hydrolase [uncultured Catonella sp.]
MWAYEKVFYQFYPMGFCGAPFENDGRLEHRILKVLDFIPHLKKMGIGAVYFSPVFESDTHGYNTRDYRKIDVRLGTNEEFKKVCEELHKEGIKVILDGVFNHVGRGFFGFKDVLEKRENSQYKDWFNINFGGNSNYNDGLWYEGWEGHYDLVKLNLRNNAVTDYLIESVRGWVKGFDIDGLRLDVAYMVDRDFLKRLRYETSQMKPDFFLAGEMIGGDYNQIMNDEMCHSATNYECYKGIYSSLNSLNLFEIMHSLNRQFGEENWTLYRGKHLLSFVDNHDVSRLASILTEEKHIPLAYALMFTMPGIPMIYYGSEWGFKADKKEGDPALRPAFEKPEFNEITEYITKLTKIYNEAPALWYGSFKTLQIANKQCAFLREKDGKRIVVTINADGGNARLNFNLEGVGGSLTDLITGDKIEFNSGIEMEGFRAYIFEA